MENKNYEECNTYYFCLFSTENYFHLINNTTNQLFFNRRQMQYCELLLSALVAHAAFHFSL